MKAGRKADSVLPESADRLEGQISALKAEKDRKKAEELWEQVLTECQNRYTDGRLLVQWLKKLNQTAGLEKDPIWYEEIEDFEEFGKREIPVFRNFCRRRGCGSGGDFCCCEKGAGVYPGTL